MQDELEPLIKLRQQSNTDLCFEELDKLYPIVVKGVRMTDEERKILIDSLETLCDPEIRKTGETASAILDGWLARRNNRTLLRTVL
jgi:hypothetical protein